jgi:hypothetical protein
MAYRNTGSYGKDSTDRITREETTWSGSPVVKYASSTGTAMLYSPTGQRLAVLDKSGNPVAIYDPPTGFSYPLEIGKVSKSHHRIKVAGRDAVEFDSVCTTEGYEKVTVPAGTFDAYRGTCVTSDSSTSKDTRSKDTLWISPELGIAVKSSSTRYANSSFGPGTQVGELISHSIRK